MDNPYLEMIWNGVQPVLPLLLGLFAFVVALKVLEAKFGRKKSRRWKGRRDWQPRHDPTGAKPDAADQLRTVMQAEFTAQPLLNKSEARLFRALDQMVQEMAPPGWQVMAQVSLGEILSCRNKQAYLCVNSKRVDLLIVDAECRPLQAIEYQGGGHFRGAHTTAARDAVKKEALRRAGIGYEEVVAGNHAPADLRRVVEKLVQKTSSSANTR